MSTTATQQNADTAATTPTDTTAPTTTPASPMSEQAIHDWQVAHHRTELQTIAALLTDPGAATKLSAARQRETLDPAKMDLVEDLCSSLRSTTLTFPMTEHVAENVRTALMQYLQLLWDEGAYRMEMNEDSLGTISAVAQTLADFCQVEIRGLLDWRQRTRQAPSTCAPAAHPTPPEAAASRMRTIEPQTVEWLRGSRAAFPGNADNLTLLITLAEIFQD